MAKQSNRYGSWAIVTGASQGIGEGFARELAQRGYNLVLVSRRAEKLTALGAELQKDFSIQARVLSADLSQPGAAEKLFEQVSDLELGLLVSNAGAARMGGFLQNKRSHLTEDLYLNAVSHMELSHSFGSHLRSEGRSGGILLVSSTAAIQPMALGANYSAAKSFVYNLGESLHREFAEIGIDVTVLLPGPTDTQGLNHRSDIEMGKLPMAAMSVKRLVREGLAALQKDKPSHIAGAMNRWTARLFPRRILAWMFSMMLRKNAAKHLLPQAAIAEPTSEKLTRIDRSVA